MRSKASLRIRKRKTLNILQSDLHKRGIFNTTSRLRNYVAAADTLAVMETSLLYK